MLRSSARNMVHSTKGLPIIIMEVVALNVQKKTEGGKSIKIGYSNGTLTQFFMPSKEPK